MAEWYGWVRSQYSLPPPNETPCSLSQPELERHGGSKATTSLQELAAARSIA
jgi:hypothetical protein